MKFNFLLLCFIVGCIATQSSVGLNSKIFSDSNWSMESFRIGKSEGVLFKTWVGEDYISLKKYYSFSDEDVKEVVNNLNASISSIYFPKPATYPDLITKKTDCAEEFRPRYTFLEGELIQMDFFSNDRFTFGLCNRAEEKIFTSVIFLRCGKDFFVINYFSKNNFSEQGLFECD